MAEFQEVMRQYARLCASQDNCSHCPVYRFYGCFNTVKRAAECNDADMFERTVMEWAAQHPEPVYPTWTEYFRMIGVFPSWSGHEILDATHIPPETAKKLGVEPKEVT